MIALMLASGGPNREVGNVSVAFPKDCGPLYIATKKLTMRTPL
jgi:hypothetical protein